MKRLSLYFALLLLALSPLMARCEAQTVSPMEKKAFITVADLDKFGYFNPKMPPAKWLKTLQKDGIFKLEYEAQTPKSEQDLSLYINETLSDQKLAFRARAYLGGLRTTLNLTLKADGITEKAVPKQIIYGDGSSLTTIYVKGQLVGNIFSARKNGRIFAMIMIGHSLEKPEDWDALAGKKIRAWLNAAK